jgi:hypothetical protein
MLKAPQSPVGYRHMLAPLHAFTRKDYHAMVDAGILRAGE